MTDHAQLTREQVEEHINERCVNHYPHIKVKAELLATDAALRATIAQQAQELECQRDKIASMRNSFPIDAASWRGVDEHDVCAECGGAGTELYGNTSTYHYSAGGQAMTLSVCDKCWGSGNKQKPWRSWKIIEQQTQELEKLTKLYATTRSALAETSTTQEEAIRQQLAAMTRERDTWKRRAVAVTDDPEYQRCCSLTRESLENAIEGGDAAMFMRHDPIPEEPQQASGSSGGSANHGAGT